jgi:hypothetical protein
MMAELKELVSMTPKLTAGAKYEKAIAEPLETLAGTRQEEAEFAVTQKEDVSRREAERGRKKAESARAEVQEIKASPEFTGLRKLEEETMGKAFIPTQDTAVDIASLYSLVNVIGMSIGAGGKQNAMQAMHAMNGMLEGYQKGRGDLYKREKDIFDTSMKTLKTKTDILQRRLKEISELASKNAAAADQEADVLFAEQGADFLKKYKEKFGLAATVKFWEDVVKAKGKATELTLKEEENAAKDAAAERRHREAMAQRATLAKLAADSKGKTSGLKAGDSTQKIYISDNILKSDVEDLKKDLTNPVLQQQIARYRIEAFLTEESKVLNQLITSDIPDELQKFLTKVRDVRNNYYLDKSGKAVTGGEALRNYGTVPQPGDPAREMINKLDGLTRRIDDSISIRQELYGLPKLKSLSGLRNEVVPGKTYTDEATVADKIATHEDVLETMKANNLTYEQTVQKLNQAGFKIQGLDSAGGEY